MTCPKCQHSNAKRFGFYIKRDFYGNRKIQRYRCPACNATFSIAPPNPLGSHYTSPEKATQIISLMVEGVSVRAISRLTDTDKNTILSLLLTIGEKCRKVLATRVRNVRPQYVEFDETWCFVHTKERHLNSGDPAEWGDAYTWIALESKTKLIISHLVGKRDAGSANEFVGDYNSRVIGRHQITSDGLKSYVDAIETCALGQTSTMPNSSRFTESPITRGRTGTALAR